MRAQRNADGAYPMSLNENRAVFTARQPGPRFVIVTAAMVFAGLALVGALAIAYAITGFVVVAGAALLTLHAAAERNSRAFTGCRELVSVQGGERW